MRSGTWVSGIVLLLAALCGGVAAGADSGVIFRENFEHGLSPAWNRVEFDGETQYSIEKNGTNSFLKAVARSSATGLATKIDRAEAGGAHFSWKWKVDGVPPGGSEDEKKTFDHTARLFIAFKTFIGPPRTINYVWANQLKPGQIFHHPSSGRSRFIVLKSGNSEAGKWFAEERDVANDWKVLFGGSPPPIVGIGFMTDSDGTQSTVTGYYDDLELKK